MLTINFKDAKYPASKLTQLPIFKYFVVAATLLLLTACGGGSGSGSNSTSGPAKINFSANPLSIAEGESSVITWQAVNSVSCRAEGNWTRETTPTGQVSVGPDVTTTYTISCLGKEGGPITESITVTVDGSPPTPSPNLTLTASPTNINANEPSTIRWSTSNADSCRALGGWSSKTSVNSSQLIASIPSTTTYSMRCTGPGGSTTESINVVVNSIPPTPGPTLDITADDLIIDSNASTTIRWNTNNAATCSADGGWSSSSSATGQQLINAIPSTTTYSMTCIGSGGTVTESVIITINQTTSGSVELNWDAPSTNADGTALTDLAGYTIYYGTNQNDLNQIININTAGVTTYVIDNLAAATYYFSMTAKDNSNNESIQSNLASKVIR